MKLIDVDANRSRAVDSRKNPVNGRQRLPVDPGVMTSRHESWGNISVHDHTSAWTAPSLGGGCTDEHAVTPISHALLAS